MDKRMLELATVGLYGHDCEWLNYRATISKFVTTAPVRPGNRGVFVFSLWQARAGKLHRTAICWGRIAQMIKCSKCQMLRASNQKPGETPPVRRRPWSKSKRHLEARICNHYPNGVCCLVHASTLILLSTSIAHWLSERLENKMVHYMASPKK